jgi:hypothetical protein
MERKHRITALLTLLLFFTSLPLSNSALSKALLEKLKAAHLVNYALPFLESERFIIVFTRDPAVPALRQINSDHIFPN